MSSPRLLMSIALVFAVLALVLGLIGLARRAPHTHAQRSLLRATVLGPLALLTLALPMVLNIDDGTTQTVLAVVSMLLTASSLWMIWRARVAQGESR